MTGIVLKKTGGVNNKRKEDIMEEDIIGRILHSVKAISLADNEYDSNGEGPANIVDGLFEISRALFAIARSLEKVKDKV